jgi:prepilin-type N-terminal cleavage/methylation domain-containing protein
MKIINIKKFLKSPFIKGDVRRTGGLNGFTLIETLVAVGVLGVLMVTLGGIMTMSFKAKNSTGNNELLSSKAVFILGELKKNILDAQVGQITCPDINIGIGNSISFMTKSGGTTTLLCADAVNGVGESIPSQVASQSANGIYNYLDNNVAVKNCQNFVWCNVVNGKVLSIGFSLNLTAGNGSVSNSGIFYGEVAPRN